MINPRLPRTATIVAWLSLAIGLSFSALHYWTIWRHHVLVRLPDSIEASSVTVSFTSLSEAPLYPRLFQPPAPITAASSRVWISPDVARGSGWDIMNIRAEAGGSSFTAYRHRHQCTYPMTVQLDREPLPHASPMNLLNDTWKLLRRAAQ